MADSTCRFDGFARCHHNVSNFEAFCKSCFEQMDLTFFKQLGAFTENSDRVALFLRQPKVREMIDQYVENFQQTLDQCGCVHKNEAKAAKARANGNREFGISNFQKAITYYTDAIRFAPVAVASSQELPLAYGNRSAVYMHLEQFEYALADVEDALAAGYGQFRPLIKLQLRQCECLHKLGRMKEAKACLDSIKEPEDKTSPDGRRLVELRKIVKGTKAPRNKSGNAKLPTNVTETHASIIAEFNSAGLYKPHPKMSSFSSKVELRNHPTKGRCLYASKDIEFGETIACTQPFAMVLFTDQELMYCHHCIKEFHSYSSLMGLSNSTLRFNRFIPCTECCSVLYCSVECRTKAWDSYHRFECGHQVLPMLHGYDTKYHLALRLLFMAGRNLPEIRENIAKFERNSNQLNSSEPNMPRDPICYEHVYKMAHHSDTFITSKLKSQTFFWCMSACFIAKIAQISGFVGDTQEDLVFAGGLLLRHLLILKFNCDTLSFASGITISKFDIASYACPILSLFNHSCESNVERMNYEMKFPKLIRATRPIQAGTELCINYGADDDQDYKQRRHYLSQWLFECHCDRCVLEERDHLEAYRYLPIGCAKCGSLVIKGPAGAFLCEDENCGVTVPLSEMRSRYDKIGALSDQVTRLVNFNAAVSSSDSAKSNLAQLDSIITIQLRALLHRNSTNLAGLFLKLVQAYLEAQPPTVGHIRKAYTAAQEGWRIMQARYAPPGATIEQFVYARLILQLFRPFMQTMMTPQMLTWLGKVLMRAKLMEDTLLANNRPKEVN